jgi:ketosteroid isomerase-like protein
MSRENVEILRAVYARWALGDFWTPEIFDPDVEVAWAPDVPDIGTYRGLAGLERSVRDWLAAWDDIRMEADEFIEVAPDRILVLVSVHGRGRGSGIAMGGHDYAHEWTMRDGRATRLTDYMSRADARKSAGLEE